MCTWMCTVRSRCMGCGAQPTVFLSSRLLCERPRPSPGILLSRANCNKLPRLHKLHKCPQPKLACRHVAVGLFVLASASVPAFGLASFHCPAALCRPSTQTPGHSLQPKPITITLTIRTQPQPCLNVIATLPLVRDLIMLTIMQQLLRRPLPMRKSPPDCTSACPD